MCIWSMHADTDHSRGLGVQRRIAFFIAAFIASFFTGLLPSPLLSSLYTFVGRW